MENMEIVMKKLVWVLLAGIGLSGCVAVPVGEPGVYFAPPTLVVQPFGYYGYYGYRGRNGPRHRW